MPHQSILKSPVASTTLLPALFVFLWSTGFIGSKVVMQYAPPLSFLAMRMALAAIVLLPILFIAKSRWPTEPVDYLHSAIVGALVHAIYLGGIFWAISLGTGAGITSLIVGLQPALTLCLSVIFLKEAAGALKIFGVLTGLTGFCIVIIERTGVAELTTVGLLLCIASLVAISAGTVYQKKITTGIDLLPGVFFQYIGALVLLAPLAWALETFTIEWTTDFILATLWLVLVLSVGAVLLLMLLIRMQDAGNVASLFYLVPLLTALEALILFQEKLSVVAIAGMFLCVAGVAMVLHKSA